MKSARCPHWTRPRFLAARRLSRFADLWKMTAPDVPEMTDAFALPLCRQAPPSRWKPTFLFEKCLPARNSRVATFFASIGAGDHAAGALGAPGHGGIISNNLHPAAFRHRATDEIRPEKLKSQPT